LAGHDLLLDRTNTEDDFEMKSETEEKKLHIMAKVHIFSEMWQGSQNLHAIQKESHAQHKHMTAVGYISGTEGIINASWSCFQHDGVAGFNLSEKSPARPTVSSKNLPTGQTQLLNVRQIQPIDRNPA
jgi:hypothetical protein